ncbi:MAG TPA: response regulator, partial [Candidatus Bathyarchaeia archaeon]|nr:response regulator [Candidatus Bathyarchaeia archaeon]
LRQQGYDVTFAMNGQDALAQVETDPPDLIVTDWMMPGMDGLALIRRLKEERPWIPVVFRSSDLGGTDYYESRLGGFIQAAFPNVIGVSGKTGEKDVALKQVADYFSASDSAMLVQEFDASVERYRAIQRMAREMGIDTSAIADESPDRDLFPVMRRRTFLKALVFAGGAFTVGSWGRAAAGQAYVARQQHVHLLGQQHVSPEIMENIYNAKKFMEKIMEGQESGDEGSAELLKQLLDGLSKAYAEDILRYRLTANQILSILDQPGAKYRYISSEVTPHNKVVMERFMKELDNVLQKAGLWISQTGDPSYGKKADDLLLIAHTPEFYLWTRGELGKRNIEIIAGEDSKVFHEVESSSTIAKPVLDEAQRLAEEGRVMKEDAETLSQIVKSLEIIMPWSQSYINSLPSRFSPAFPPHMVEQLVQLNKAMRDRNKKRNAFIAPHIAVQEGDVLVVIGWGHLEGLKKLLGKMEHVTVTESQDSSKLRERLEEFRREWEKKWGPAEGDSAMLVKKFYTPVERHRAIEQAAGLMEINPDVVEVPDRDFASAMGRRDFLKAAVLASGAFTIGNWGCATTRQTYVAHRQQVHLLGHQHVTPTTIVAIAEAKVEWEKILTDREIPESSKIDRLRESIDGLSQEFADDIKRYRATAGQILDILDKPGAHYRYISSEVTPRDKALAEKLMKEFDAVLRKIVPRISKAGYPDYAKKAEDLFLVAISPEFYLWFKGELRRRKVSIIAGEDAQLFEESEVPFTTAGFLLDQSRRLVVEDRATEEDAKTLEELINGYEILMPWNQAYIDKLPSRFSSVFPAHMYKWLVNLNNDMREMVVEKRNAFIASHIGSQNADVLVVIGWLHVTGLKERLGQMENVTVEESRAPSQVIDDMIEFQKMWKDGSRLGGDGAMLGSKAPGGIDMSPSKMNLREEGEAVNFVVPPGLEDFENLPITGFTPVILDIIPVADISLLLASAE